MNNIATFGCSFTAGTGIDSFSWAEELAKLEPSLRVDNYSLGGTSVKWAVSQLLAYKGDYTTVLQLTNPHRITLVDQRIDYAVKREQITDNYCTYATDLNWKIITFNVNCSQTDHTYFTRQEIANVHKVLYTSLDLDIDLIEWKLYIDYAIEHADFTYFQLIRDQELYFEMTGKKLPCVQEYIGIEQYAAWVYDGGDHLNAEGSQEAAKWVKSHLTL
jgi:hypothetical protein